MTPPISANRRRLALLLLAFGGFGIGITEFSSMGMLPQIAESLLPAYASEPEPMIALAGHLISIYALGVVLGAPTLAVLGAKLSQTKLALLLLGGLAVGNLLSALMPDFLTLSAARFLSGLPHGAYFGVAALLAARLMGPGKQAQGVALALSGLTVANIFGVPLGTWLGQTAGWRWTYALVAVIFAVALLGVRLTMPKYPPLPGRNAKQELAAFGSLRFWTVAAVGAIGVGGFFAVYSYLSDAAVRVVGLDASVVPFVLMVVGVGMTFGNIVGGRAADKNLRLTGYIGFATFVISLVLYALFAATPVMLFVTVFLISFTQAVMGPAVQTRLIQIAGPDALIGAAMNHAGFNLGNSIGAMLGGLVIAQGYGYLAPAWVGAVLATAGMALYSVSFVLDRRVRNARRIERNPGLTGPIPTVE